MPTINTMVMSMNAQQAEVKQLSDEVARVSKQTSFNGKKVLDGSFADSTGIANIDVTTENGAYIAMKKLDAALDDVNSARATLGALIRSASNLRGGGSGEPPLHRFFRSVFYTVPYQPALKKTPRPPKLDATDFQKGFVVRPAKRSAQPRSRQPAPWLVSRLAAMPDCFSTIFRSSS